MTDLKRITQFYSEYVQKVYKDRLHAGDLLWKAGSLLLKIEKKTLSSEDAFDYYYMLANVSTDLLKQVDTMANTRVYDSAPMVEDYYYMAFNLAYLLCEKKPSKNLLPFLSPVLYYKNFKDDKTEFNRLKDIFFHSTRLEQKYIDYLLNTHGLK